MLMPRSEEEIQHLGELGDRLYGLLLGPDMSTWFSSLSRILIPDDLLEDTSPRLFVDLTRSGRSPAQLGIMKED